MTASLLEPFAPPPPPQRCPEAVRDYLGGYSRCHGIHGHPGPHHVRGRTWTGRLGNGSMRLAFGEGFCTSACQPELVQLWGGAEDTPHQAAARRRHQVRREFETVQPRKSNKRPRKDPS
jgi:hypothetical protein